METQRTVLHRANIGLGVGKKIQAPAALEVMRFQRFGVRPGQRAQEISLGNLLGIARTVVGIVAHTALIADIGGSNNRPHSVNLPGTKTPFSQFAMFVPPVPHASDESAAEVAPPPSC